MGGSGSGRWRNHSKRPLVEQAMKIDFGDSGWQSVLAQPRAEGTIEWRNPQTGALHGWASFILSPTTEDGTRRSLVIDTTGDEYEDKQVIELELTPAGWSIPRWLARCPKHCDRRAQKLYAVHQGDVFSCWRCADLSYRSSQQHDARVDQALRDPLGFQMARNRAPQTSHSMRVTTGLTLTALERATNVKKGRGWGKRSITTSGTRLAAQIRQELIDLLEEAARVARGG